MPSATEYPFTATDPVLTVITVVRNAAGVIGGCIDSVLAQHIDGLEYIVIDGASTDGTLDIIKTYGSSISRVVSEPDKGLYDAMNKGLRLARGRYLHFLNADDRYVSPGTLKMLLPQLKETAVNYGQIVYAEAGGRRLLGAPFSWQRELRASNIPQPALFVARSLYAQVGEFDLRYRIAADYDMVLRLAGRFPVNYIREPITIMHAGGLSHQQMALAFSEAATVSHRHGRSWLGSQCTRLYRLAKWQVARRLPPAWIAGFRTMREAT